MTSILNWRAIHAVGGSALRAAVVISGAEQTIQALWRLTTFFPKMVASFAPGYVFIFFCGMMVMQLVWVKFMVPETKGVPLEDMQRKLGY